MMVAAAAAARCALLPSIQRLSATRNNDDNGSFTIDFLFELRTYMQPGTNSTFESKPG
jgi:hypothetical protein